MSDDTAQSQGTENRPSVPDTGCVRVLLLRHGQSEWNAVRRWQGTADSPLTPLGREQAAETAWALAGLPHTFSALFASDLSRALDTARIIGDALALGAPVVDARLREAHAGEWEGMTPDEIELAWPGWIASHRRPPSFEPYHEVVDRTVAALRHIAALTLGMFDGAAAPAALVVAHSGVIRSVVRHLGRDDDRVPNLGGIWLLVDADGPSADRVPSATVEPFEGAPGTDHVGGITLLDVFDPAGIVISGVDAPGEDPGDEPDDADAHRSAEH